MSAVNPNKLSIVYYPDPILRKQAAPIEAVTDEVRAVALRMIALMHEAEGVGLAAPQVGLPWRMFVANSRQEEDEPDRVYINPVLSSPSGGPEPREEGCLSIPDVVGDVRRPITITIDALDLDGQAFTMTSDALLARVWQHETDHLDGILIIDHFTQMTRLANRKALRELERG
ncbi:MAG: peptide deformylase [Planctomycetes bacterium]|nr:peptide deformylase [Planctomycetota bacterium]NOG54865.1 peptide deformylase [Planctomycetota bacterium]